MENGAAIPVLGWASTRLISWGVFSLPLNAFARELVVRLSLGICQFNPNVWRLVISMQVLWNEVFRRDRPLTMDEFLFC